VEFYRKLAANNSGTRFATVPGVGDIATIRQSLKAALS
jgi:hypothetical protein